MSPCTLIHAHVLHLTSQIPRKLSVKGQMVFNTTHIHLEATSETQLLVSDCIYDTILNRKFSYVKSSNLRVQYMCCLNYLEISHSTTLLQLSRLSCFMSVCVHKGWRGEHMHLCTYVKKTVQNTMGLNTQYPDIPEDSFQKWTAKLLFCKILISCT